MLTIVCSAYAGHSLAQATAFIGSLQSQTDRDRWKCILVHDGKALAPFRDHINYLIKDDPRFSFIEKEKRPANEFGTFWRSWATYNLVDTEWTHYTNLDNIYFQIFVKEMLNKAVQSGADIIMNNIVHRYAGSMSRDQPWQVLSSEPMMNWCDYQSYIIKTELVKKTGFNHLAHSGQDGLLVQECASWHANTKVSKVERLILGVHQ